MRGEVSEILCCPESALSRLRAAAYRPLRTAQNLEWWTRLSTQPPPARPLDLGASTAALLAAVREVCATPPGLLQLAPCRQPLPVAADEAAFEAVLLNLVCNSLLYGGPAPALTLRAARQGSRAVLLLRDGGPGIPPHRQRAALQPFESFSHLPSAGWPAAGGAVRPPVRRCFHSESRPGRGVCVALSLPLCSAARLPQPRRQRRCWPTGSVRCTCSSPPRCVLPD